jgi:magnesium transporter
VTEVVSGLDAAQRHRVAALRARGRFFWLDLSRSATSRADLVEALGLGDSALAALDARAFRADGQSVVFTLHCYVPSCAPVDEDGYRLRPIEVRVLVTRDYLLTLHEERLSLPAALTPDLPEERSRLYALYSVLEAMLASTGDALEEVELRLDAVAATWTAPRATLRAAGARLATMRRWLTAQQTVFVRLGVEIRSLPGFEAHDEPYFDRLDEQIVRLLASIDAAANGMGMLLDLQLNERAYVVSVLAAIFVPLTFVTGFFGMNFGWMVDRIDTEVAFWLLALVIPAATAVVAWRVGLRRLLLGDEQSPGSH